MGWKRRERIMQEEVVKPSTNLNKDGVNTVVNEVGITG